MRNKWSIVFYLLIAVTINLSAQVTDNNSHIENSVYYEENKNQWPEQILYKAELKNGAVFIEQNKFTFATQHPADLQRIHELRHEAETNAEKQKVYDEQIRCHSWSVSFEGAKQNPTFSGENGHSAYSNYFIGNNPGKWASNVKRFGSVFSPDIYNGIGLRTYSVNSWFKYDFIIEPGADITQIKLRYDGVTPLLQNDGTLLLRLSTGAMQEQKPIAWQIDNGFKIPVRCNYKLNGNLLSFEFPDGYSALLPLIIDPILAGSTFSGSTSMTFGYCATHDNQGRIYTGGMAFSTGYPVTSGAYNTTFGGGTEIAISKYNNNVSALIFATYLGGADTLGWEAPLSMTVSANGNLYLFGITISTDFPVSAGAFDATHNGLTDIFVSELNASGSLLIASTYIGGSNDDGPGNLIQNVSYKGDLTVNNAGQVFVVSTTQSINFPVTAGALQPLSGGGYDGVVFSLQPGLNGLTYSTYLGGSGDDNGSGLTLDASGTEIIVCGTTGSTNFPVLPSSFQPAYSGGISDGFITHLNASGSSIIASTFFGTASSEGISFIDTDASGNIYILGASYGNTGVPITAGVYSNPGSSAFITKFDAQLQTMMYSTQIGSGSLSVPYIFAPTALMVDECENVHFSGFGDLGPTTANALYSAANSPGALYVAVLAKDALALNHATLFGGDHIEGSACRFDSAGTIYHAACQGLNLFPTPVWAYDQFGPSNNYDVCAVKIVFPPSGVLAQATITPGDTGCVPFAVTFSNASNGTNYFWDFGDGSPVDTSASPNHTFINAGSYTVTLIAEDSTSCIIRDTLTLTITVLASPQIILGNDTVFCSSISPLQLDAGNPGLTYTWNTGATSQTISAATPGIYWVTVDNGFCSKTDSISIALINEPPAMPDTVFCQNQQLVLTAGTGQSWLWNTGATSQTISVTAGGLYWVAITDGVCQFHDTAAVIMNPNPIVNLGSDTLICLPDNILLDAGNSGASWLWNTGATSQQIITNTAGNYSVSVTALNCTSYDTITVDFALQPELGLPQTLCAVQQLVLNPGNFQPGTNFIWNTGETTPSIIVNQSGTYSVTVQLAQCLLTDSVEITGIQGEGAVYIPNTFTPNRDGINEQFLVAGNDISDFHMKIFNRWGQLIFESYDPAIGWNGTFNNTLVQEDTYVVVTEYRTACNNNAFEQRVTHLNVLR